MDTRKILPLIFTDLDGSLLDHYTYSFKPASESLKQLAVMKIPVIPNTSKTRAELLELRRMLALCDPFIVENGAAVYLPQDIGLKNIEELPVSDGYSYKAFSKPRRHWLEKISLLAPELQIKFHGFSTMSVEDVVEATGLSTENAELAMARDYNEPASWTGTEAEKDIFITLMQQQGAVVVEGGRFLHVGDLTDKGSAMSWLTELYQRQFPEKRVLSIALGDGNNDKDMLENADMAVVIKSPVHPYPQVTRRDQIYFTKNPGPTGWVEGLTHFLQQLNLK